MGQEQPTLVGLDRGAAVAHLDELPRKLRATQQLRLVPEMNVGRAKQVVVLAVEARGHHEVVADLSRKERHSLVLHASAVERADLEVAKVRRLDELRQHAHAVVGRVRRAVLHAAVGVGEAHEAGVLDAAALVLAHGKDHPLREREVRRELELVVRVGEPEHAVGELFEGRARAFLGAALVDGVLQIAHRELVVEETEDRIRPLAVGLHLAELGDVERLVVERVVHRTRRGRESRRRVQGDPRLSVDEVDEAGAKLDGRDVPLAARAKAQDEARRAARHAVLVGVENHRRIEERDGLQRVLAAEVGAGEEASLVVRLRARGTGEPRDGRRVVLPEDTADVPVSQVIVRQHARENRRDLGLGKRVDAVEDRGDARAAAGQERPRDHAAGIGGEAQGQPSDVELRVVHLGRGENPQRHAYGRASLRASGFRVLAQIVPLSSAPMPPRRA